MSKRIKLAYLAYLVHLSVEQLARQANEAELMAGYLAFRGKPDRARFFVERADLARSVLASRG